MELAPLMQTWLFWCSLHAEATPSTWIVGVGGCGRSAVSHMGRREDLSWSYRLHYVLRFVHSLVSGVSLLCVCLAQQGSLSLWVCFVAGMVTRGEGACSLVSPCLCFWWIVKGPPVCFENLLQRKAKKFVSSARQTNHMSSISERSQQCILESHPKRASTEFLPMQGFSATLDS